MKEKILISACLMGEACRYDGQGSERRERRELLSTLLDKQLIPVCPEVEGGLPIPRPPAEIQDDRVLREDGSDVTLQFKLGSQICRDKGLEQGVGLAILKSRSPACGCGEVYDGSFTRTLVKGNGIFTQSLLDAGIECISDEAFVK